MALKFRRGTTAQQSGSLAFGEPYVNTTLGTLLVGGVSSDIQLAPGGASANIVALSVSASAFVSASSLKVTGNASIDGDLSLGGKITIGDASSDTLNVVASLSSSLIPETTNAFDLGSTNKVWRDLYISTGSIKFVDGTTVVNTLSSNTVSSLVSSTGSYAVTGSNNFRGNQTITGSLVTSGSIVEFNVGWPSAPGEQHIVKTSGFTLDGRTYEYAGFALTHYEDSPGTLHNAMAMYMFDPTNTYGSELVIGPYRTHMRSYPSGSGGNIANISVQDLTDGRTQALVYGDIVQIGAFHAESIVIGNSGSITTISGSISSSQISQIQSATSSFESKFNTLGTYTSSVDSKFSTLQTLTASTAAQISRLQESTASLNAYTSSNDTTNSTQNSRLDQLSTASGSAITRLTALEAETLNLELFTSSINTTIKTKLDTDGVISGSSQLSGKVIPNLSGSFTGSYTGSFSGSFRGNIAGVADYASTIAVSSVGTTTDTTLYPTFTLSTLAGNYSSLYSHASGSFYYNGVTRKVYGEAFVGAIEATNGVVSGSSQVIDILSSLNTYTGSNDTTNTTQNDRLSRLEESTASLNSLTSSYARINTANTFNGNQIVSGSLTVTQDLVVLGSSSIQNVSSSTLNIGTNLITVAVNQPSVRFGGIAVIDSGSAGASGSLLYDSVDDEFIFVHRGNGLNVTSSHFVLGPETIDNLGNETYLTNNRVPKGTGKEHLNDSNITDTGTLITLDSNTIVNGTLLSTGTTLVSGSSQIDATATTNWASGIKTQLNNNTVISGSSQVNFSQISGLSANIISASSDSNNIDFIITGGEITANLKGGVVSGSSQIDLTLTTNYADGIKTQLNTNTVVSGSSQIDATATTNWTTGIKTQLNSNTVVSGSSQVVGILSSLNSYTASNDTTNTTQTSRLDQLSTASGSAISRLTALEAETANLETYTGSFAAASVVLSNKTISGASNTLSNIANASLTNSSVTVTAGTGLSGGGAVSLGSSVTLTNAGVTSNVAGSGISVSGATGAVTITNSGVRSIAAGTGVAVSATTGDNCSISIGQSVATNATPTFGNLTINGTITATGDITAYYTSDRRHKNNIQIIPNALEKVSKLNGVTWEWNDDVNEVTKSTPKTGLIAQEVQEVLPEVVKEREDGFLSLDYSKMVGLLVEAIKEQQSTISKLESDIKQMADTVRVLEENK